MIEEKPKSRKALLIWLIVSQALAIASLLFWLLVAATSVMAFDAGETTQAWIFVIAVWSYPIFPIVMAIGAWIAFAFRKNVLSAILSGLTFALPLLFFIILWVVSISGFLFSNLHSTSY
ncbi:MAG: hypothetical protein WBW94_10900 [Anaerolineales bacterium]